MIFHETAAPRAVLVLAALVFYALTGFFLWRAIVALREIRASRARTKRLERFMELVGKIRRRVVLTEEELDELDGLIAGEGLMADHCPDCDREKA